MFIDPHLSVKQKNTYIYIHRHMIHVGIYLPIYEVVGCQGGSGLRGPKPGFGQSLLHLLADSGSKRASLVCPLIENIAPRCPGDKNLPGDQTLVGPKTKYIRGSHVLVLPTNPLFARGSSLAGLSVMAGRRRTFGTFRADGVQKSHGQQCSRAVTTWPRFRGRVRPGGTGPSVAGSAAARSGGVRSGGAECGVGVGGRQGRGGGGRCSELQRRQCILTTQEQLVPTW